MGLPGDVPLEATGKGATLMLANISERDRRTLQFGGFAVGAILFLMLVGFPAKDKWDDVSAQVAHAEGSVQQIQDDLSAAANARMAIQKLRVTATVHPDVTSLNQQPARMLQEVQGLPAYRQISVARLEGLPLRQEDKIYRSAVSLQFNGGLAQIHQFLKEVDGAKPGLKVERLSLLQDAKEASQINGQMVIAGYAVVLKSKPTGKTGGAQKNG